MSFRHALLNHIDWKEDPAIFSRPRNSEGRKKKKRETNETLSFELSSPSFTTLFQRSFPIVASTKKFYFIGFYLIKGEKKMKKRK